jgi:hypothetical protein
MRRKSVSPAWRWQLLYASLLVTTPAVEASPDLDHWWQTECSQHDGAMRDVSVRFRDFSEGTLSASTDGRPLLFGDTGIQYRFSGHEGIFPWSSLTQVTVRKIGDKNPALALTLVIDEQTITDGAFGIVEYSCWRAMEAVLKQHVPTRINGSPPLPHWPLYDTHGNQIKE